MPPLEGELLDAYFAKTHQEHAEDKDWLHPSDGGIHLGAITLMTGDGFPGEVACHTREHRDWQSPILGKSYDSINNFRHIIWMVFLPHAVNRCKVTKKCFNKRTVAPPFRLTYPGGA